MALHPLCRGWTMNRMLAALLILSGLVICPSLPAQDGRLEKLRKDVRGDETAKEPDAARNKATDSHDSSDPDCDFWGQLWTDVLPGPCSRSALRRSGFRTQRSAMTFAPIATSALILIKRAIRATSF
jgi:hypothetical protein